MSKVFVVFGATGHQGSSVVSYVNKNLSDQFKVRAVTRDASKPKSKELEKTGVEVVEADVNDKESVKKALKGADAVFAMSVMAFGPEDKSEVEQGKTIADAAVEENVPYIIWSTLVNAKEISNGEFAHVKHFDEKHEVETYIRSLPIKSSFFSPGCFLQNFNEILAPQPIDGGAYALFNVLRPSTKIPFFDTSDSGKFVGSLLTNRDKFEGKIIYAASGLYSFDEIANEIRKTTAKDVIYNQIPPSTFSSFLPPPVAEEITEMFQFFDKYGLYGPQSREKVEASIPEALEKPTGLEEFFKKNPISLK